MTCGIYKIECVINNKCYVGSSKNIEIRFLDHKKALRNNTHYRRFQNGWNKYGEQNFIFEIIEECVIDELLEREQYWLDTLQGYANGYNSASTSDISCPRIFSEEYRKCISERTKEAMKSDEVKKKMSKAQIERFARDGVSDATRKKQSIARTGKRINVSEDNRKRKADMCSERHWTEESKNKISKANSGNKHRKGKRFSEESKKKISEGLKKANAEKRRLREEIE